MKKMMAAALALVLVLTLAGCGKKEEVPAGKVYSFSGECDEFRIVNGVAVLGGEQETFYGGNLEIKTGNFKNITGHSFSFYVDHGGEEETIMNNAVVDRTSAYDLKNQETGQIWGTILNFNTDVSVFEQNLHFSLTVTEENGENKTFTMPLVVKEIAHSGEREKN